MKFGVNFWTQNFGFWNNFEHKIVNPKLLTSQKNSPCIKFGCASTRCTIHSFLVKKCAPQTGQSQTSNGTPLTNLKSSSTVWMTSCWFCKCSSFSSRVNVPKVWPDWIFLIQTSAFIPRPNLWCFLGRIGFETNGSPWLRTTIASGEISGVPRLGSDFRRFFNGLKNETNKIKKIIILLFQLVLFPNLFKFTIGCDVLSQVFLHIASNARLLVTKRTSIWCISFVEAFVRYQVRSIAKRFATSFTNVR